MSVINYVYILLRLDSDGGYDYDYPIEAVFSSLEEAEKYCYELITDMRENEEIDEETDDDELFEIVSRPLINGDVR